MFSENHSHCRAKKENWIVQKNDRIEPIVSEATWNLAQEKVKLRLLHQNTGGTVDRRDTSDKIVCKCCGKNFYICHSKKKGSGINSYPYFICATKKKEGKSVCDNDNVQVKKVDIFIEDLAKTYYKNIRLSNKAKLIRLQGELKNIKNRSAIEINNECEKIKSENVANEEQLSKLIDNFLDCSEIMKRVIDKKIKALELIIQNNNNKILELERSKANIDADKIDIENKIKQLKKELSKFDTVELTREELMDKIKYIKVDKGNQFIVEYR